MKIYLVGGAVRDTLMGLTPKDKDYVVVGSSTEEMLRLGYKQVGQSFPVFLHPETGDEYALARKEKKIGLGHGSFDFETDSVTLKDDLMRRDLTINAIAMSEDGTIIDYFGGLDDLKSKTIRHVSEAFAEDPLRVLRAARFAARYSDFTVHPDTIEIMRTVAKSDDFKSLSTERVFMEMKSALSTKRPSIFFEVLKSAEALEYYFPELHKLIGVPQVEKYHPEGCAFVHTMMVVDQAAQITASMEVRFAALVHDFGKGITPEEILPSHHGHEDAGVPLVHGFCDRLKIPNELRDAAIVVTRMHLKVHRIKTMKASSIVKIFYEMDAFRRPHLVDILSLTCVADEMGKLKDMSTFKCDMKTFFEIVKDIGFKDLKRQVEGKAVGEAIRELRVLKLKEYLFQELISSGSGDEQ